MEKDQLENIIKKANAGDKASLEEVVLHVKDYVYNLSLKMLLFPEDAKDATQEILIKVITHLSAFNFKSQFETWVYRISTNYLLNFKAKQSKELAMSFAEYGDLIDAGHSTTVRHATNQGELKLLEEEVKVSCTQGLLLCLVPMDRLVYIFSEILEFNSIEGAEILAITPENYRKKLSRARTKIRNFVTRKCGLVNASNPCRCVKKIDFLIDRGAVDPDDLKFANLSERSIDLIDKIGQVERSTAIYRSVPEFRAPKVIFDNIKSILSSV